MSPPSAQHATPTVVFLHGLESGPHGSKYRALAARFSGVVAPDCEGVFDPDERLRRITAALAEVGPVVLVGSSFGGLMACLYASAHPSQVSGLVLCAPALHARVAPWVARVGPLPRPLVVLHGLRDDVVPVQASRDFVASRLAARPGIAAPRLIEVDDGHRLSAHRELMVALAAEQVAARGTRAPPEP